MLSALWDTRETNVGWFWLLYDAFLVFLLRCREEKEEVRKWLSTFVDVNNKYSHSFFVIRKIRVLVAFYCMNFCSRVLSCIGAEGQQRESLSFAEITELRFACISFLGSKITNQRLAFYHLVRIFLRWHMQNPLYSNYREMINKRKKISLPRWHCWIRQIVKPFLWIAKLDF